MRATATTIVFSALACLVSGCTSDNYVRQDGMTLGAGDAIASNTAMQMVDPWQYGVQGTRLHVPAQRAASASAPAASSGGPAPSSVSQTAGDN